MGIFTMAGVLNDLAADYTAITLDIIPDETLPEMGDKTQKTHKFDDGSIKVYSRSDQSYFDVTLNYLGLGEEEAGTILDLWHSPAKANGLENTFYWQHPKEVNIYTVRFMGVITKVHNGNHGQYVSIKSIKLRVEGNKP